MADEVQASRDELRQTLMEYIDSVDGAAPVRVERHEGAIIVTLENVAYFEELLEAVQQDGNAPTR